MKYYVRVGNPSQIVEVDIVGPKVTVDGAPVDAHLAAVAGTPLHHLLLDGYSWTIAAEPLERAEGGAGGRWVCGVVGERIEVEVVDERTRQIEALTGRRPVMAASGAVVAPMPGLVVRVQVVEGQHVAAGAALVVVEAMKMENELRASRASVVRTVHVAVGQAVEKGAILVTLEGVPPVGLII